MTTRAVDAPDPAGTPWKDTPRGQEIRKRVRRPSAVEVAMVAAPIYGAMLQIMHSAAGSMALALDPMLIEEARQDAAAGALTLIAEAERQLGEGDGE